MTGANQVFSKDCVPDLLVKSRWLKSQQYDISALSVIWMSITDSLPHGIQILCGGLYPTLRHWDINQHTGMFLLCWSMRYIIYMRFMVLCLLTTSYRCCPNNSEYLKNVFCWQGIQKCFWFLHKVNLHDIPCQYLIDSSYSMRKSPKSLWKNTNVLNISKKIQHSMDREYLITC